MNNLYSVLIKVLKLCAASIASSKEQITSDISLRLSMQHLCSIYATTPNRKMFPDDQSAMKVICLAMRSASKKWTMPIRVWKSALNRFTIEFGEPVPLTFNVSRAFTQFSGHSPAG